MKFLFGLAATAMSAVLLVPTLSQSNGTDDRTVMMAAKAEAPARA